MNLLCISSCYLKQELNYDHPRHNNKLGYIILWNSVDNWNSQINRLQNLFQPLENWITSNSNEYHIYLLCIDLEKHLLCIIIFRHHNNIGVS